MITPPPKTNITITDYLQLQLPWQLFTAPSPSTIGHALVVSSIIDAPTRARSTDGSKFPPSRWRQMFPPNLSTYYWRRSRHLIFLSLLSSRFPPAGRRLDHDHVRNYDDALSNMR